jgi:hypothetical protein
MQFESANIAIVPPIGTPTLAITTVAVGSTGWNINASFAPTSTTTIFYRITVAGTSTSITNYSTSIAGGSSTVFVPVSTAIGNRTETLEILTGSGYAIGSPNSTAIVFSSPSTTLTYSSDGDANGFVYWLGTNLGTTAFSNPVSIASTLMGVQFSSSDLGSIFSLTDRIDSNWYSLDIPNQWVTWDLKPGHNISITKYTLRARNFDTNHLPRNWVLEGTNSVSAFDVSGLNGATWTAIDTRVNDATIVATNQYYTLTPNGSAAAYRYLRLRQNGVNSNGANYLNS